MTSGDLLKLVHLRTSLYRPQLVLTSGDWLLNHVCWACGWHTSYWNAFLLFCIKPFQIVVGIVTKINHLLISTYLKFLSFNWKVVGKKLIETAYRFLFDNKLEAVKGSFVERI